MPQPLDYAINLSMSLSAFTILEDERHAWAAHLREGEEESGEYDRYVLSIVELESGDTVASSGTVGHRSTIMDIKVFPDQRRAVSASSDQWVQRRLRVFLLLTLAVQYHQTVGGGRGYHSPGLVVRRA